MTNIYEQPWLLLIVSAVVLLVVFVVRAIFPKKYRWLWLLPVLLAVSAFALDYFVKTDAERVKAVITQTVKAAEEENVDAMFSGFCDDYRDSVHPSKQSLMSQCRWWLSDPVIKKNILRFVSVSVEPLDAEVIFTVRIVFDPKGPVFEFRKLMIFKLHAYLTKHGDDWCFSRIEILEIDLQPADWQNIQGLGSELF